MKDSTKNEILELMKMISSDVESDVKSFDEKTMAKHMGNYGAAIMAITEVISKIVEEK